MTDSEEPPINPIMPQLTNRFAQNHGHSGWRSIINSMKRILPQWFAALAIYILIFVYAFYTSPKLWVSKLPNTSDNIRNVFEAIYYHGIYILSVLGLILGGVLAQMIGSRIVFIMTAIILFGFWLIFNWISSAYALLFSIVCVILGRTLIQSASYVFLAEICQPNVRRIFMATLDLTICLGTIVNIVMNTLHDYKNDKIQKYSEKISLWGTLEFIVVGLAMILSLPESPYWLAGKKRNQKAESSLLWFRGRQDVKFESTAIINNAQNNIAFPKSLMQRSFYVPLAIVFYVNLIGEFSGDIIWWNAALESENAHLMNDEILFFKLLGILAFILGINKCGIRKLTFISMFCVTIVLLLTSIAGFLLKHKVLVKCSWRVTEYIGPYAATFFSRMGITTVPSILIGELFPSNLRFIGAGIGLLFKPLMYTFSSLIFSLIIDILAVPTTFLFLAILNAIGCISLLWILPGNDNMSLVNIEKRYSKIDRVSRTNQNELTVIS